jgi:RNA polymerase sigma-70 factor (ECF subfamily)
MPIFERATSEATMKTSLALGVTPVSARDGLATGDPDAELVRRAKTDASEFLALYERYFTRVFGYVRVRIPDRAGAEDVTSHIFTTALSKLNSFRGRGPFAAWLFKIARNAVRDEQRRTRRPTAGLSAALADGLATSEPGPEELLFARERRAHLRRLLSGLRPDQQHLLALRYGAGMSFEELGVILGTRPGTARVRVHRVLEELRRRCPNEA